MSSLTGAARSRAWPSTGSWSCGCGQPIVQSDSDPIRNWHRPNVTCLTNQINNGPMILALVIGCKQRIRLAVNDRIGIEPNP
jgi:hypothetical protein